MFENIISFFKNIGKKEEKKQAQTESSKDAAKERLHLVLMQDRANVSADFLELMKQEIIEVIKKYIEVDEKEIDVRLTNQENEDGTNGAPALYANIPILNIKNDARKIDKKQVENKLSKKSKDENQDNKDKKENKVENSDKEEKLVTENKEVTEQKEEKSENEIKVEVEENQKDIEEKEIKEKNEQEEKKEQEEVKSETK